MGKRIGFIDAMRGLAMLLVVIGHVLNFSVCHLDNAIMRILSDEVEIPLFFMVSGFLVNIPKSGFWKFLGKKAFLLFVPAAVFMVTSKHQSLFLSMVFFYCFLGLSYCFICFCFPQ